jgi:xanthine/uracil permease
MEVTWNWWNLLPRTITLLAWSQEALGQQTATGNITGLDLHRWMICAPTPSSLQLDF